MTKAVSTKGLVRDGFRREAAQASSVVGRNFVSRFEARRDSATPTSHRHSLLQRLLPGSARFQWRASSTPITMAGTVQGLDVLLLDRLLRHEGNVRLTRRPADRLGFIGVIPLPPHERLHILRADDLHCVPECFELPRPTEGAGAGFNHDRAALHLRDDSQKLIVHDTTLQQHTPIAACKICLMVV